MEFQMDNIAIEYISTIILLVGLVIIYNFKEIIENNSKTSFQNIVVGLSLLGTCSAFSILSYNQVLTNIPLLNSSLFFQLLYWIGIITGMILLLSGVSNWLPVYRKHLKVSRQEFKKLEIFKIVEQLIRFENRNTVILMQTIDHMVKQYNFQEVSCFIFSQKEKVMNLLATAESETNTESKSNLIQFNNSAMTDSIIKNNIELIYVTETHDSAPDLLLPLKINGKLLGAFCIYSDEHIDDSSITNLKLISDIISEKIYSDSKIIQNKAIQNRLNWITTLEKSIDYSKTVKENMSVIKNIFNKKFDVDFMKISFNHNGYNRNITISENNQVLENITLIQSETETENLEHYVTKSNLPVIIRNIGQETDFIIDINAMQADMKSMVAYPITSISKMLGVIVLASNKTETFSVADQSSFYMINNLIGRLILNSIQKVEAEKEITRRKSIHKLMHNKSININDTKIYQEITDFIVKDLSTSFARISLFDSDRRFLNSQALTLSDEIFSATPFDATMMLSIMPNHHKIIHSRNTLIVNELSGLDKDALIEHRQIFGSKLSQYVIVPFFANSKIIGLMSLGFTKDNQVITENDVCMLEDIASVLTVHHNFMYHKKQNEKLKTIVVDDIKNRNSNSRILNNNITKQTDTEIRYDYIGM